MNGVGDDGHAIGEPAPDERDNGEGKVNEEGREDVSPRTIAMQMYVIMRHNVCLSIEISLINAQKYKFMQSFAKIKEMI